MATTGDTPVRGPGLAVVAIRATASATRLIVADAGAERRWMMSKYLVVANRTLGNPALVRQLQALADMNPRAEFVLLVPRAPIRVRLFPRLFAGTRVVAPKRIAKAKATLTAQGIGFTETVIGSPSPAEAVAEHLLTGCEAPGVVLSTLPGESSRWLKANVPQTIQSRFGMPVYQVTAPASWTMGP